MRKEQRSIRACSRAAAMGGVLAALLAASQAAADEDRGFYGRLNAGYGFAGDSDLNLTPGGSGEGEFDAGFGGGGSLGYYIGPSVWRRS